MTYQSNGHSIFGSFGIGIPGNDKLGIGSLIGGIPGNPGRSRLIVGSFGIGSFGRDRLGIGSLIGGIRGKPGRSKAIVGSCGIGSAGRLKLGIGSLIGGIANLQRLKTYLVSRPNRETFAYGPEVVTFEG